MSVRYSYDSFSTKGHGVIETGISGHSDEYVLYEIENEIPRGFKCVVKTKNLTEYIKDPNHSISYGRNKQKLTRACQIKSQLTNGRIIRADNNIFKQTPDGFFEVYQLRRGIKVLPVTKRKVRKPLIDRRVMYKQSYDEIYRNLSAIQENAQRNRER